MTFVDFTQPRPRSDMLTILEKLAEQVSPYCDGYPQSDQKSPSYLHFEEKLKDGRKRLLDVGKAINEIFIASGNATVDNVQMLIDSANAY